MPLAARLAAPIIVALLPALAVLAAGYGGLRRAQEERLRDSARQEAGLLAAELSQLVGGVRQVQALLAEMPQVRGRDPAGCADLMRRARAGLPLYGNFVVADASGDVWCDGVAAPGDLVPRNLAGRHCFRAAMATGSFAVGRHAHGLRTGAEGVHVATPYLDALGRPAGVVSAALDLEALARHLDRPAWGVGRAMLVADAGGTILVRHPGNDAHRGRQVGEAVLPLLDTAVPGARDLPGSLDTADRMVGYVPPAANAAGFLVAWGTTARPRSGRCGRRGAVPSCCSAPCSLRRRPPPGWWRTGRWGARCGAWRPGRRAGVPATCRPAPACQGARRWASSASCSTGWPGSCRPSLPAATCCCASWRTVR